MRKAFLISLGAHIFLFIIMYIATLFSAPMKPPKTVYSVKIIAAPQEPTTKIVKNDNKQNTHKEKPKPRVISKPKRRTRHKSKPKSRPKPKPTAKSNPTKTLRQGKASLQVEGKNFTDDFYLNLIITKIANNWLNPLRGGRKISTVIYFKIQKNGDVTDIEIEKSSGNKLFDQSAKRAVMASSPLPSLPESYTGDFLGVHFEFQHAPY